MLSCPKLGILTQTPHEFSLMAIDGCFSLVVFPCCFVRSVVSLEPLIILWDNFVDEEWIQTVLKYNKRVLNYNKAQSSAMWCVALNSPEAHKLRAYLLLRGVAEQPIISGSDLCVRGNKHDNMIIRVQTPPV